MSELADLTKRVVALETRYAKVEEAMQTSLKMFKSLTIEHMGMELAIKDIFNRISREIAIPTEHQ